MGQIEVYMLARNLEESGRLNQQSKFLRALFKDSSFHPSIPRGSLHAIADVGTGTGIWLEEVRRELEDTQDRKAVQYIGFDISPDQFPSHKHPALEYVVHDAVTSFPEQYHERFDLVHLRFLSYGIRENQLEDCVNSVSQIIRPGGYLQWEEIDGIDSWTPQPDYLSQDIAFWIASERTIRGLTPAITGPLIDKIQSCSLPMNQGLVNPMCWTNKTLRIYQLETISTYRHPSVEVESFKIEWHTAVITRLLQSGAARRSALVAKPGIPTSDKKQLEKEISDINNYIQTATTQGNAIMKDRNSAVTRIVARKAIIFDREDNWMSKWHLMARY